MLAAHRFIPAATATGPIFRDAQGAYSDFSGSGIAAVPAPVGLTTGDYMFAFVVTFNTHLADITVPSGWTLEASDDAGVQKRIATYSRVAGGSEPSSYTWTNTTGAFLMAGISAYYNITSIDEAEAHSSTAGLGTANYDTPAMTVAPDTDFLIFAGTASPNYTAPTSPSNIRLDLNNSADGVRLVLGDWQMDGTGATQVGFHQTVSAHYATAAYAVQ